MIGGKTFRPGDVVVAPVLYSNQSGRKDRPVVILCVVGDDVVACSVTSANRERSHTLILSEAESLAGGLKQASTLKIYDLSTIHYSLIRKRVGHLTSVLFDRVRDEFRVLV